MPIAHYRELAIYRLATTLRQRVFEESKNWPSSERFALTQQVRRSSRAIGANVAEGWSKRRYPKHFVAKLTDALGEAEETTVWLDVARECGYVSEVNHSSMVGLARQVCSGLVRMARHPDKWCGPASLRTLSREPDHAANLDALI